MRHLKLCHLRKLFFSRSGRVNSHILEVFDREPQGLAVHVTEAVRLEVVPDDGNKAGVVGGEFTKAADGEGNVFDRVPSVVFGCR